MYNKISPNYTQKIPHSLDLSPFEKLVIYQEIPLPFSKTAFWKNKKYIYIYNKISVNYMQKIPHSVDVSPFEKLAVSQEIPLPFSKTIRFISVLATACQLSLL